jgi:hypothetical protein
MVEMFCDRCGKKLDEKGAYYTIDVYGHDVNPTNDGRVCLDAASMNIATNMTKMLKQEKHYCRDCINEMSKFMSCSGGAAYENKKAEEAMLFETFFKRGIDR